MGVCCCNSNRQAAFVMGIIFVVLNIVGVIVGRNDPKLLSNSKFLLKISGICAWIIGSEFQNCSKNFKTLFVSRYQKIFSWCNSNGSKTTPKFFLFFQKLWTLEELKVLFTRGLHLPTDWVNDQSFLFNVLQTYDEQTLKISSQYLERFQIYCHLTEKFWQLSAYSRTNWPILYGSRQTIARICQLNGNKSETTQDIDLKFSAFVHHMFGVKWPKNFNHCLISWSVAPSSVKKL